MEETWFHVWCWCLMLQLVAVFLIIVCFRFTPYRISGNIGDN